MARKSSQLRKLTPSSSLARGAVQDLPSVETSAPTSTDASQHLHVVAMHRILKASFLITQPFFTNHAERYNVTMNELRIVMTLSAMPNAAVSELAHATGMHPMNVSRAIASLTAVGRIRQRRDSATDRRRKIVSLTPKGWTLYNNVLPHVKKIAEFMFESMSDLEVEFLSKLIRRLIKRLEDVDPSSPLLIDTEAMKAAGEKIARPRKRQSVQSRRERASSDEDI